ncbi:hypothetical protein F4604DRAFT_1906725 [Suillus subluteus]|nr:hypothetical protein F4604DRAFT_1906725 [Suillus subluteus]
MPAIWSTAFTPVLGNQCPDHFTAVGYGDSPPKRGHLGEGFRREASVNARHCEVAVVEIPRTSVDAWVGGERKRSPMRGDGSGNSPPKRGRLGVGFRWEASVNARHCEATLVEIPHPSVNALVREMGGRVNTCTWLAEEEMQHGAWLDPVRNGRRGHDGVWYPLILPAPFFLHPHLFLSPPSSHLQVKGPLVLCLSDQSLPCLSFLFSSSESRIHRHYGNLTLEQKGYDKSLCSLPATRGTNPSAKDGVIRFPHLHDPIHCHFL